MPSAVAALIVNTGTPQAPRSAAVRSFLRRFLSDPRVIELPRALWLPLLYGLVLPLRAPRSARKYREIWREQGSPLLLNTSRLLGGAFGLAILSTIADSHTSRQLAHGASSLGALTSGYQLALGLGALTSLLGAFLTVVLLRPRAPEAAIEPVASIQARQPDEARAA